MGLSKDEFYDRARVSIMPMAFCFPGYNAAGSDLPPPPICAKTWRQPAMDDIGDVPLTLLVGGYAQKWHLGGKMTVADRVARWRDHAPRMFPLPHPSWRNTGWIKKNQWFETDLIPALRRAVARAMTQ